MEARLSLADASIHASLTLEDPEQSEWYSTVAKVNQIRSAQLAAVKDYMSNTIYPKMLLKTIKIVVKITGPDGAMVESGHAVKQNFHWRYKATVANTQVEHSTIELIAYDRFEKLYRMTVHAGQ